MRLPWERTEREKARDRWEKDYVQQKLERVMCELRSTLDKAEQEIAEELRNDR